jgi:hypothetical protein
MRKLSGVRALALRQTAPAGQRWAPQPQQGFDTQHQPLSLLLYKVVPVTNLVCQSGNH